MLSNDSQIEKVTTGEVVNGEILTNAQAAEEFNRARVWHSCPIKTCKQTIYTPMVGSEGYNTPLEQQKFCTVCFHRVYVNGRG